ncbi:DUF1810 domain-containing protein [Parvularcula dongshanensis]|uniref:Uncharacterized protein (DUF1810 family) n=1 Tax=Parvularcula dongshanensis TaxID=1173995 RepID=A0A840I243_9PROT|nr:DUF1810 domain-containing protein [Parvularcula dongshanensis]MBB4658342.1 uncharacterized protein (DUF1810 family) [Parvularcula dongshanensis]
MSIRGDDPYDLERFVDAQLPAYARALGELRGGEKQTHWIWYIFPQIAGLGSSPTAQRFAIKSLEEAAAYLAHDVLGARLRECTEAVLAHEGRSANAIFGHPDDLKFKSSMTLFERAAAEPDLYARALDTFYGGERDAETLKRL